MAENTDEVIATRGLRRTFKSRKGSVEAVAGIDLKVRANEVFGFLGPNGAGKTTTLRMLATLLEPTSGEATVAGFDLRGHAGDVCRHIGYVGQAGGADPHVSGREELILQGRLYDMSKAQAAARAADLIERFEIADAADRLVKTYSGGQRRRLDIAIGLMHHPQLLFLDEPTTGLDPQARARMWDEVRGLRASDTTVFLTTHYLEEADALCDRLAIIDHGKIVAEGSPDELKRQISGDAVTIGVAGDPQAALALLQRQPFVRESSIEDGRVRVYVDGGDEAMPGILRLLDSSGLELRTIALSRPSLEDVFLRKTGRSLREVAA